MSAHMLTYLSEIVATGIRTSSGFKKVHLNACAKALNEHFKVNKSADHIANHLRTWKRKYAKINQLRKVSGAIWNEKDCVISLDYDHYTSYIADHKGDDEYFNKPVEHYKEMATIFGNSVATGKFAKGSNEPLGTEGVDNEGKDEEYNNIATPIAVTTGNNGASSSFTRPSKRVKITQSEDDGLIGAFSRCCDQLAKAIEKGSAGIALQSYYYAHLVEKPHVALAFNNLPIDYKLSLLAKFVAENFPGC